MLSPEKLTHKNLEYLGAESGIHFYKVISRMGNSLQVTSSQLDMKTEKLILNAPRISTTHVPVKTLDKGDMLEFEVTPGAPSVFILSQKFHRDWQALAYTHDGWQTAQTSEINGVFQSVLLPSNTQRVHLEFRPFARHAWIAHVFWTPLLIRICFKAWQEHRRKILERA